MPVDEAGNENPEVVEDEVVETAEETPQAFTQEQVNEIVSARIAEVRNQSAEEIRALTERAEGVISGYRQAVEQARNGQVVVPNQIQDDPEPPGLTRDQKIMWDANKPTRLAIKQNMQEFAKTIAGTVKPLQADSTSTQFFALVKAKRGKDVPEALKNRTVQLYRQALSDPETAGANPERLIEACWNRALAIQQEEAIFGGSSNGNENGSHAPAGGKKAPRIGTPGAADLAGSGTRIPGTGTIGKKATTWQEDMEFLTKNNLFPEDLLPK